LVDFADHLKEKIIQTVREKKRLMWEVNLWWLVYNDNKNIFNPYQSSHDSSILINY
jgi:hypothetical protein